LVRKIWFLTGSGTIVPFNPSSDAAVHKQFSVSYISQGGGGD
jgi:hypothetical protein